MFKFANRHKWPESHHLGATIEGKSYLSGLLPMGSKDHPFDTLHVAEKNETNKATTMIWLVVLIIVKNICQLGWKIKHVPNHQPVMGYRQPRKSRLSHAYASPVVTAVSQKSRCISLGAIYKKNKVIYPIMVIIDTTMYLSIWYSKKQKLADTI